MHALSSIQLVTTPFFVLSVLFLISLKQSGQTWDRRQPPPPPEGARFFGRQTIYLRQNANLSTYIRQSETRESSAHFKHESPGSTSLSREAWINFVNYDSTTATSARYVRGTRSISDFEQCDKVYTTVPYLSLSSNWFLINNLFGKNREFT